MKSTQEIIEEKIKEADRLVWAARAADEAGNHKKAEKLRFKFLRIYQDLLRMLDREDNSDRVSH